MFEVQLLRIRGKIDNAAHLFPRPNPLGPRTSEERVRAVEAELGLSLPTDLKEFVQDLAGLIYNFCDDQFPLFLPLFDGASTNRLLTPVPMRWRKSDWGNFYIFEEWQELSFHEKTEYERAFVVHEHPDGTHYMLMLTGPHNGTIWSQKGLESEVKPVASLKTGQNANFIDWFEDTLDRWLVLL